MPVTRSLSAIAPVVSLYFAACGSAPRSGGPDGGRGLTDGSHIADATADDAIDSTSMDAGVACATDSDCPIGAHCVLVTSSANAAHGSISSWLCELPDAGESDSSDASLSDSGTTTVMDAGVTCGPSVFGPEPATSRGGQRVFDSRGYLYVTTYNDFATSSGGTLGRVPPGGGMVEVLKDSVRDFWGTMAWVGVPYVRDDDTLLVGTSSGLAHYDPSSGSVTLMDAATTNGWGYSPVVDAVGRIVLTASNPLLFAADGTPISAPGFATRYAGIHNGWYYAIERPPGVTRLSELCPDGLQPTGRERSWPVDDAYGIAFGPDGSVYVTQGNTSPPAVLRVDVANNHVSVVSTIPNHGYLGAQYLAADAAGLLYVVPSPGHTVWRVDPATGAHTVYGCEPSGPSCGSTM